jgi:SAM-dependent methyltransferase
MISSNLLRCFPEAEFGGYSDVDGTVAFYSRINSLLQPSHVVVDFGCGRGGGEEDLVPFRKNLRVLRGHVKKVIGLDVDAAGRQNLLIDEFKLLPTDGRWPVENTSVDLVYSDFVIEHLLNPDVFFQEAQRVLKTGGYICLRTPNVLGYVGIVASLVPRSLQARVLRKAQPDRLAEDVFPAVYRCNTIMALKKQLSTNGFHGTVYGYEAEPAYMNFSPVAYSLGTLYAKLAPGMFKSCLFAFARKA